MDALSDVLKSIRLEGAVYMNAEFTAPWCVSADFGSAKARAQLAGADQMMFFHYLVDGTCKVRTDGNPQPLTLQGGDLLLFLKPDRHLMGSNLELPPADSSGPDAADALGASLCEIRHGGGGEATRFVCGYLACSRSASRPLLDALPRMLRIPVGDSQAGAWIRELLQAGVSESVASRPGANSMLAKLSELLFVEAMRRYAQSLPPEDKGWLAGVRDTHVGRALALLHGDPARAWTVDELAREVALSRSALAERFVALVGDSPMQYLTRWRLALAAQTLRANGTTVARVAERSGYESEAAFCRAFKREFGVSPTAWRKAASAA